MAEISKLKASQVRPIIAHAMRGIPGGKANGNEAIDETKTELNYSLINRGDSVNEINQYRQAVEKEIFHFKRKDIVRTIQFAFQVPPDCPPEQEPAFFQACHDFTCKEILPMGEKSVFVSQVHQDEFYKDGEGNVVLDSGGKVLSKKHLHIMAIPAVPDDKHEGYSWRLCADQLTKRAVLKSFHTKLQNFIDNYRNEELGITDENPLHATVLHKQSGDGKTIALSVKQLKEITRATGITIDKSITIERLGEILRENRDIKIHDKELKKKLHIAEEINHSLTKENHLLRESQMDTKILQEKERLLENAQEHIRNLETELEKESLKIQAYEIKCNELEHENDVLRKELEKQKEHLVESEDVWGTGSGWDDDVNDD